METQTVQDNQEVSDADRVAALATYFKVDATAVTESRYGGAYDVEGEPGEYEVYTDQEADEKAAAYIKESLWAFNSDFLAGYMPKGVGDEALKALKQSCEKLCEGANGLVEALVGNRLDDLIADAISCDGRGHFMSSYDGEENEVCIGGRWFYIYRVN